MENPESEPFYIPTSEQLVPTPPPGLTPRQKIAFYTHDLHRAIGSEFIEPDTIIPSPTRAKPPRYRYRIDYEKHFPEAPDLIPDLDALADFISEITKPR